MASRTLLLSVDLEDWHQLVRRRLGLAGWERVGPELARQTNAVLELFDSLGARATFFVLGLVARTRPELVAEVAAQGHEIACHGDAHRPVFQQTPSEFTEDLRAACDAIGECTGVQPQGYRAPAFSITGPASGWAFAALADQGFAYDSSQRAPRGFRDRGRGEPLGPHLMALPSGHRLWELPVAAFRLHDIAVPAGGASYWSLMPDPITLWGLGRAPEHAGLYLHPHELGPDRLRIGLPPGAGPGTRAQAALRTAQRELARRRTPAVLRTIAEHFELIPYGKLHATLSQRSGTGPPSLPG